MYLFSSKKKNTNNENKPLRISNFKYIIDKMSQWKSLKLQNKSRTLKNK